MSEISKEQHETVNVFTETKVHRTKQKFTSCKNTYKIKIHIRLFVLWGKWRKVQGEIITYKVTCLIFTYKVTLTRSEGL